jgi:hypothetical protein
MALLALCVVAWLASYRGHMGVSYWGDQLSSLGVNRGRCIAQRLGVTWTMLKGWHLYDDPAITWTAWDEKATISFLGFSVWPDAIGWRATVPMWFLLLLSAVQLRLVWHKTEGVSSGRGFPVEATGKGVPCPICGHDVRELRPNEKCPKCGTQVPRFGWKRVGH